MRKVVILSLISLFSASLSGCQSAEPIRDGKCTQLPSGALPVALDPDCGTSTR